MLRSVLLLTALTMLGSGCSSEPATDLSGEVTLNGAAVKKGNVRLEPDGGLGTPYGGEIADGRYLVKGMKPGKYKLHIEGEPEGTAGMSQAEAMKLSEKELARRSVNPVPEDAQGNDVEVEVNGGVQTQDVKLTTKPK